MILNIGNFIRPTSFGDKLIYIQDPNGVLLLNIDPYSSEFYSKGAYVHILSDGKININNLLQFNNNDESIRAVGLLNDAKKSLISSPLDTCSLFSTFIPLTGSSYISGSLVPNNGNSDLGSPSMPWRHVYVSGSTIYFDSQPLSVLDGKLNFGGQDIILITQFDTHTGSTQHLTPWMYEALESNSGATSDNPFATISDLKKTQISETDLTDNYLIYKITGSTFINIVKTGSTDNEILSIEADLSNYYNKQEINSITDTLSGQTTNVNAVLSGHTSDTTIHFTKSSILLNDLGDVNVVGAVDNQILSYSGGTWVQTNIDVIVDSGRTYSKSEADDMFVNKSGSTMSGELTLSYLANSGVCNVNYDNTGKLVAGNQTRILTGRSNTGLVDMFNKYDNYGVFWNYVVRNGTSNVRAGIIYACWDTNGNAIEYTSTSTTDIGNTSDISFYVDINDPNIRLWANCTVQWEIKLLRIFI